MNKKLAVGAAVLVLVLILAIYFVFSNKSESIGEAFLPTQSVSSKPVSEMVLSQSDFPEGYSMKDRVPRTSADVVDSALEIGWIEGYIISFTKAHDDEYLVTTVYQYISRYPSENISSAFALPEESEGKTISPIEVETIGDDSYAYKVTNENDFAESYGYYEIIFRKKDILVTMQMLGTAQDFELLESLAQKAASKI